MRYTYYRPFAKRKIVEGIRLDLLELKEALYNFNARTGGNQDSKIAIDLIQQYLDSLPKRKEKKWERKDYLLIVLVPSLLTILGMALDQKIDWIYPWIAIGALGTAGLLIPLLGAFGVNRLFSHSMELWWYKYWRGKIGIESVKTKIIDQTIENPLAH